MIRQKSELHISRVLYGVSAAILTVMLNFISPARSAAFFWNIDTLLPNNDMLRTIYPDFDKFNPHGVYPVPVGTLGIPIETSYAKTLCEPKTLFSMMHFPRVHQAANAFKVGIGNIFFSNHIIEFSTPQLAQKYFYDARNQLIKCHAKVLKSKIHRYGYTWLESTNYIMDPRTKQYNDRLVGSVLYFGFPMATSSDTFPMGVESYTTDARIWGKVVYWTVAQSHTELSEKVLSGISPNIRRYTPFFPLPPLKSLPKQLIASPNR